jgi:hypothetical protein
VIWEAYDGHDTEIFYYERAQPVAR